MTKVLQNKKTNCLIKIIIFMKNLENYGVQTLNAQEIRKTEGGQDLEPWLPWLDAAYEYITSLPWSDVLDEDPNMSIPISA